MSFFSSYHSFSKMTLQRPFECFLYNQGDYGCISLGYTWGNLLMMDEGCFLSKAVFDQGLSPMKCLFTSNVILGSSTIKGHLPAKVIFHKMFSSVNGHISSKLVCHQRLSSIKTHLPPKVISDLRLSSIKVCHLLKLILYPWLLH